MHSLQPCVVDTLFSLILPFSLNFLLFFIPFIEHLFIFSFQIRFSLIPILHERNEPFPTAAPAPEPPMVFRNLQHFTFLTETPFPRVPSVLLQLCQYNLHCTHPRVLSAEGSAPTCGASRSASKLFCQRNFLPYLLSNM